jgi:hypothetical protein
MGYYIIPMKPPRFVQNGDGFTLTRYTFYESSENLGSPDSDPMDRNLLRVWSAELGLPDGWTKGPDYPIFEAAEKKSEDGDDCSLLSEEEGGE